MQNSGHTGTQPLLAGKCGDGSPRRLEHAIVEGRLMCHRYRMQACGHGEDHMEVLRRDNLLPSESNPLLPIFVLALRAMPVAAAVVADLDLTALGANLHMATKGAGTALRHVAKRFPYRRHNIMGTKKPLSMVTYDLTDVEACSHCFCCGKRTSIILTACLADPECAVIDKGEQGLCIQWTSVDKSCHLLLGEDSRQSLLLSDFGHAESVRLLVVHYFVVGLESEDRVLEEGLAAPVPVEQHREIPLDVVLCELFRQLLEVQHGLSDFQAIVIDAVVRILCDAHLFSKKFNTSPEFGNGFYSLVQNSFGHGVFVVEGINDGGISSFPSSSSTFYRNVKDK